MENNERVLLVIVALAIVGLILFTKRAPIEVAASIDDNPTETVGMSLTPDNVNTVIGPAYLMANVPWAGAPPVYNAMPQASLNVAGVSRTIAAMFRRGDKTEEG